MKPNLAGLAITAGLLGATPAYAGVYADDLGKCLSASVTADDRKIMVQAMFLSLTRNPAVAPYSTITSQERASVRKAQGQLNTRLLTIDCRTQAVATVRHEGDDALWGAFSVLGELTFQDMFGAPEVKQGDSDSSGFFDAAAIAKLLKEADTGPK
jgi:hypothetical protein